MDALTLLLQLFFTSFVILLPIVVGGLAFRRLTKSKTSNAWVYAVTCLFATVTTAGLLPWALGLNASSWFFFVLAAFCPAMWFAITTICDVSRKGSYDVDFADMPTVLFKTQQKTAASVAPLVLNNPVVDTPAPIFSHRGPTANIDAPSRKPVLVKGETQEIGAVDVIETAPPVIGKKSVLDVAREMRRNKSSEERRPKLLPSPTVQELPFIKSSSTA